MRRFAMTWLEEENVLVVAKMAMHPQKHAPASTSPMRPKKDGVPSQNKSNHFWIGSHGFGVPPFLEASKNIHVLYNILHFF